MSVGHLPQYPLFRWLLRSFFAVLFFTIPFHEMVSAEAPLSSVQENPSKDARLEELNSLYGYFPFKQVTGDAQWGERQQEIRQRVLVSQGLWPLPTKTPLQAVIHGRVEREDYVVDRVYFQSLPGHFVTGSLYRPKELATSGPAASKSLPAILSPHGHWKEGRFYDAGEEAALGQVEKRAETSVIAARYPIQARAVHLARMGCLVFVYDMTGYADSIQLEHRPGKTSHLDKKSEWGFMSAQADLRLQNMMGLQTWNSIRAIDFLLELGETDPQRIGVTGASGGGTQAMILGAIDDRIAAAMPCVMVSTAMQGGCSCENASLLRIGQGNVDMTAAIAPRPLGLTAADDWTVDLKTKGYPDLAQLYQMLGHSDCLSAVFHTQFKHNYNQINRTAMYGFFNQHFQLRLEEPVCEKEFLPLSRQEASVWNSDHPQPSGDQVGDSHEIRMLQFTNADSEQKMKDLMSEIGLNPQAFRDVVGGGWETILGRRASDVHEVAFHETHQEPYEGYLRRDGWLTQRDVRESIPVAILSPLGDPIGIVVLIEDWGKQSIVDRDDLSKRVKSLIAKGYTVIAADLLGQGETTAASPSPADDGDGTSQRMWYHRSAKKGWHRYSGFTYGYNHCLFVQRTHDILAVLQYAQQEDLGEVHLVGLGKIAGPLALAAHSQSEDTLSKTIVDLKGFRFESIRRQADPMFVPGCVKYLDVDGLLALGTPGDQLCVVDGADDDTILGLLNP